jgi:hypothetical protein
MLDLKSAPKTNILYITIQWTFLQSLVQICFVVSLGGPVLNLWIVCRSEIQDGRHDST